MLTNEYPQIVAISKKSASEFQDEFNAAIKALSGKNITDKKIEISGDVFSAVITYEVVEHIKNCVADDFHEEGIYYLCKHCPYLDDPHDKRIKYCTCKYSETGRTHKQHEACELFYKQVKLGKIVPLDDFER